MKIKTNVKAGKRYYAKKGVIWEMQHNQMLAKGLKVKTGVKAGEPPPSTDRT